jgi:hypothetical protein
MEKFKNQNLILKLNVITLIIISFFFQSCSTNDEESAIDFSKIESVKNIKDYEKQKIAFGMLTKSEKHFFWKNKLNRYINSNVFNSDQLELVNLLLSKYTPEVYEENNYRDYFNTIVTKDFIVKASKLFSSSEINEYFCSINGLEQRLPGGGIGGEVGLSCNCNNATIGGFDCAGLDFRHCTSPGGGCTDTSLNCGVFNTSPCDGVCRSIF